MKRCFPVLTAVAFVFSAAGFAVAAEKAAAPAAVPAAQKAPATAPAAEKKAARPKAQLFTGTVEAVDVAAGTLTVKGKKGNVDLKAGEKVKLGDLKVGDKVVVKHADGSASSVKAVNAARAKRAEPKAEAKPAAEKKTAPAAAPAAAPAKPAEKK
jgi:hypothetical protein